jgi:hypothetical protein
MSDSITWRALHRCDDLIQARAVVTAIAAMEFDARIVGAAGPDEHVAGDAPEAEFPGPYVIEVPVEDWSTLKDALPEIIAEQEEFDRLTEDKSQAKTTSIKSALAIVLIVMLLYLLARLGG